MNKKIFKFENWLDIPEGIIDHIPKIVCYGNHKVIVENFKGITEYDKNVVNILSEMCQIRIFGEELELPVIVGDEINILGKINNIEFER